MTAGFGDERVHPCVQSESSPRQPSPIASALPSSRRAVVSRDPATKAPPTDRAQPPHPPAELSGGVVAHNITGLAPALGSRPAAAAKEERSGGRDADGGSEQSCFESSPYPSTPFPGRDRAMRAKKGGGAGGSEGSGVGASEALTLGGTCGPAFPPPSPALPPPSPVLRRQPLPGGQGLVGGVGGSGVDAVGTDLDPRVVEDLLELLGRHLPRPRHSHAREGRVEHARPPRAGGCGGVAAAGVVFPPPPPRQAKPPLTWHA